jgi:hypothetical protein
VLFEHKVLGFSLEFPDDWRLIHHQSKASIKGYPVQKSESDLPSKKKYRRVLAAQEILNSKDFEGHAFEEVTNLLEIIVWKDNPSRLSTHAKKYPVGDLAFKALLRPYGDGGQHAEGQLDLGKGLVLHLTAFSNTADATKSLQRVLKTGKLLKPA